jgi:tRNA A58 N-methylase Trm61
MNANPMVGSEGSTYVMGRTSEEYERLRRQAELLESITGSVLDRVGLRSSMRCLDVGCGPGEVMRLMAERVGPAGHVSPWPCGANGVRQSNLLSIDRPLRQSV